MLITVSEEDFLEFKKFNIVKFLLVKTDVSFLQIKSLIRKKKIKINNQNATDQSVLSVGDVVEILNYKKNENLREEKVKQFSDHVVKDIKNSIIYEDEDLIFFNKKRGICVQGGTKIANSLEEILSFIYDKKIRIVHRIDKETTGIIIFAKNYQSANKISSLFQERKIQKTYIAITDGIPKQKIGEINKEIFYKDLGLKKTAITEYEILETNSNFALLKIFPKTGRKHQIRIHLSSIDCPIIGDAKYNKNYKNQKKHPMQLYSFSIKVPGYQEVSLNYNEIINFFKDITI